MNHPEKILVVEDDPLLRENLRTFLESIGFEVLEAEQGESGIETCIGDHPDLVLLDINLPGKNGFEVCRSLKANPEIREIPVIFVSGSMETNDKLQAFSSGGVDYVSKPFQLQEVEVRVRTHLEIVRQRYQLEESRKHFQDALSDARRANHLLIEVNERLRVSEELQSHFIANMRNEINDPLGSILGLADEICDPRLSAARSRDLASLIKAEAFQLEFELRNIFCAAELESGEISPSIAKVDIDSMLQDVADTFASRARQKEQVIAVHVAEGVSSFPTDAEKLHIILANLLANALEFSPVGSRIELRARLRDVGLIIEVEDHGSGLSETDISHVFERFRQLDEGHTRSHKGQGLGLAVVKALVELLKGQVSVNSQLGRGSTFTCHIPALSQAEELNISSPDGKLFIFEESREL